ncbi:proprotein convertase subtilisin/kexin type 5-like [Sphaerodactylus townsendi]|uniref:proprotein convertase subtilisin/kexin type 5-like n=1 Tax=Sphaerodactylus townsendi TaxID=933632 RepID=UPI00202721BF|nr:proprotein convertase subtilisin/kexin type 5-like [Sphaerodactylus townsendi]
MTSRLCVYALDGKCVNDCGVGFYSDEITAECEPCHRTCATCEGFNYNDCTSCKGTLELFHGKCVKPRSKQTDGKFWNERQKLHISNGFGSANLKYRLLLYVHSQSLQSTENDLLIVPSVYRVQAKRAVREVFSVAAPQLWKPLPLKVHQTQSLNTVRKRWKFLFDGFCIHTCPQGTFGNMKMRKCENCTENCEKCIRTNHCLKCQSDLDEPHYLYQGKCLLECPEGFFAEDGICTVCSQLCKTCKGNATWCQSCETPLFLEQSECKHACSEKHFAADGVLCEPPFFLHNQSCLHDCPSGFFDDTIRCFQCHESCEECEGPDSDDCTKCLEDTFVLYNNECIDECPEGTYYEEKRKACQEMKENVILATRTVRLAVEDTADNACPATQVGTVKSMDVYASVQLEVIRDKFIFSFSARFCFFFVYFRYYPNEFTSSCEKCHKTCKECMGPENTDCLSCDAYLFLLPSKNECQISCPEHYFENYNKNTCERCHPTCSSCSGKGALSCTSCVWSHRLAGGICYSECFAGEYKISEEDPRRCEKCHETCTECKGFGPLNCTICPPNTQLYLDESRCVPCCKSYEHEETEGCCDCSEIQDECILHTSMKLPAENKRKTVALVVASSILLILTSGAIVFIWKRSRTKLKPVNQGGYEKLVDNTKTATSFKSNHHQSTSYLEDQMIEYKDRDDDDDDDDDDDIVYMGQDGTVYRKFKYGLLEDDAEDELEYDDESYSFR